MIDKMLTYTNYITTPSGKVCDVKEIKNDDYFVLLKFTQAEDYQGFYKALDSIIIETIPDFKEYNIVDKAYIYIATCYYSVHNTIITEKTVLGNIQLSLTVLLDAIENCYSKIKDSVVIDLSPELKATISLPNNILFSHESINIDYFSGLSKIKEVVFESLDDKTQFASKISPKLARSIESSIKKAFSAECNLFNDITINLSSPEIFYIIMQIYAEQLDDFYELLYYHFEYLKWSYDTFKNFTPLETRILFNFFKEDKERQAQEQKQRLNTM